MTAFQDLMTQTNIWEVQPAIFSGTFQREVDYSTVTALHSDLYYLLLDLEKDSIYLVLIFFFLKCKVLKLFLVIGKW